jgi:hypothetical protein
MDLAEPGLPAENKVFYNLLTHSQMHFCNDLFMFNESIRGEGRPRSC